MVEIRTDVTPVRPTLSAAIRALPGILLLTLYLWIGVGLMGAIVIGMTRSTTLALAVGGVLSVPGCVITWRIVRMCVEVERYLID